MLIIGIALLTNECDPLIGIQGRQEWKSVVCNSISGVQAPVYLNRANPIMGRYKGIAVVVIP